MLDDASGVWPPMKRMGAYVEMWLFIVRIAMGEGVEADEPRPGLLRPLFLCVFLTCVFSLRLCKLLDFVAS